jgi:hypothetical protein
MMLRGGPLDILGVGRGNFPCNNFFEFEAFSERFFPQVLAGIFF